MKPQFRIPSLNSLVPRFSTTSTTTTTLRTAWPAATATQTRWVSKIHVTKTVPAPTPITPDVPSLLKVLGRGLSQYADKFPSWDALFTLTSPQMKELGIEPPKTRRYLLNWLERYRHGLLGPGGDFKHIENGEAILKVAMTEDREKKWVVNVGKNGEEPSKVRDYKVRGMSTIVGPYALPMKAGEGARVEIVEGMWEFKVGQKVDGGERRRAEVRYKRKVAQRKAEREAALIGR